MSSSVLKEVRNVFKRLDFEVRLGSHIQFLTLPFSDSVILDNYLTTLNLIFFFIWEMQTALLPHKDKKSME